MAGSKPEIGAKIVLDGAEEYQRSLKEVANAQKDLNKEMKLAESEFKKTGDAQQLYNEKVRLLNAQMDNQKKKLETAQKALKELSDKGVDKNSDLWRKWNGILLDSQTKMNNLQAELNSTTAAMKDTADATEQVSSATERATQETADYSGTLKSIDKGVKFQAILSGLKTVKDTISGVISTAYRMAKALVMSEISGGDWAREIMMGAAEAGVSVEEYQARMYAQAVSGIDTSSITEGIKKTTENLATTDTELLKLYNDLGISTRNADGSVRDATDTFWNSVDALKGIEDQTTRSIYAQKLLGDQYMKLRALVDLGSEGYEKLIEEGKESAVVTEDSVKALSDMDAVVEKTKATAQKIGHSVQAELAPGFTQLAEAFSKILQDFDAFLSSEEGKNVLSQWNKDITSIAEIVKDADLSDAFTKIANSLSAIRSALEWIVTNYEAIKNVFDFVMPVITGNTVGIATNITENLVEHALPGVSAGDFTPHISGNEASAHAQVDPELLKRAEELKKIRNQIISAYVEDNYEAIYEGVSEILKNKNFSPFISNDVNNSLESFLSIYTSGKTDSEGWKIYGIMQDMLAEIDRVMAEATSTAETGGGGAMTAFNAAIEKGTQDTQSKLKSGVAAAFSGMDSLFASMGTAHGSAYINALSAQMSRINSMLFLSPSYAYGGTYYNPAQSAYASPTSTANVSLYVGREKFGQVATPIVDARMGADLMTMR